MNVYRKIGLVAGLQILFSTLISPHSVSAEVVYSDKHLLLYDSGVVHDIESGLEWYAGPDQAMSWEEAKNWVSGIAEVGGGWRMPTKSELDTLHQVGDGINNISYLLYNSGYWMWAGQTKKSSSKWIFSFSYGGEGWNGQPPDDGGRAIAVRDRKSH